MGRIGRWALVVFLAVIVLRNPDAAAHLTLVIGKWLGDAATSLARYANGL